MNTASTPLSQESWLSYRTVWRWHFYAGVFCIPFVIWLAITGSIYLFKPQIDAWIDRPYDRLDLSGPLKTPAAEAEAALAAVPGSTLHYYELPKSPHAATRVIVGRGTEEFRVYIHPRTLAILHVVNEDRRFTRLIFHLHGELLAGDIGSMIVELASSWAIVLIVTGLYLWWPRQAERIAGIFYPRLKKGKRIFWRDLHAVTGMWISLSALFLLLTGLQWATVWGGMFKEIRTISARTAFRPDWSTGRASEIADRVAMNQNSMPGMDMPGKANIERPQTTKDAYLPLNRVVSTVTSLGLAYPVMISPPTQVGGSWSAKSDNQNRLLRTHLTLDARSGALLTRQDFQQQSWLDRMLALSVSIHEGQLFGIANQLLGLLTCIGLVLLCFSAVVLWWRRRAVGVLGAPVRSKKHRFSWALAALSVAFGLYLPMLGASLVVVLLVERFILGKIPSARLWLGLEPVVDS